jgi:hypothetical protein
MKRPQVRSAGSLIASNVARIVGDDRLKAVTGSDGVMNTKLPQLHAPPTGD